MLGRPGPHRPQVSQQLLHNETRFARGAVVIPRHVVKRHIPVLFRLLASLLQICLPLIENVAPQSYARLLVQSERRPSGLGSPSRQRQRPDWASAPWIIQNSPVVVHHTVFAKRNTIKQVVRKQHRERTVTL